MGEQSLPLNTVTETTQLTPTPASALNPSRPQPARRPYRSRPVRTTPYVPASPIPLASLEKLQAAIGVTFKNPALLLEAITHSTFAHENPHLSPRDNERQEHLGDSVLQLGVAEFLYRRRSAALEGELTQTRSAMVNTFALAHMAEELELGSYLQLGHGITHSDRQNIMHMLANTFEAVIGALFLDQGYDVAVNFYLSRYRALPTPTSAALSITPSRASRPAPRAASSRPPRTPRPTPVPVLAAPDYKQALQAFATLKAMATPTYETEGAQIGSTREYISVIFIGVQPLATGTGSSQLEAEQDAAKVALVDLGAPAPVAVAAPASKPVRAHRPRRRHPVRKPVAPVAQVPAAP
jgi:ribonuclease-3